ncbi:MAG: ferredoxin [Candidatus Shapirobacteria bacterium]
MKTQTKVLLSTILVSSAIFAVYKIKDTVITIDKTNTANSSVLANERDETTTEIVLQKLSILNDKCRGCGKCIRIDPAHFEFNQATRKAMVISSTNLNSVRLAQAINSCQDNAIILR